MRTHLYIERASIKKQIHLLSSLTCGDSHKSFTRVPRMEAATTSEQRAHPAVQHATPFSFHLTARVSIANTWNNKDD